MSGGRALEQNESVACTECGYVCRVMVWDRGHDRLCYNCIEAYDRRANTRIARPNPEQTSHKGLPPVGTALQAHYKGQSYAAQVTERGVEYGGQAYRSLTAAAQTITHGPVSGPRFWEVRG